MHSAQIPSQGMTLPELMATICIAGILMAIAIPSFMDVITSNRTIAITNRLTAALAFARSEAIKRGIPVAIRHKGETASVWEEGWDIFTDENGDGVMNTADELLKTYEALPPGHTLRTAGSYTTNRRGWFMDMISPGAANGAGERVMFNPILIGSAVVFPTFIPINETCQPGADGWLMELDINGARLNGAPLDFNNDGKIDDNDEGVHGSERSRAMYDDPCVAVEAGRFDGVGAQA
ncbi:MAG: prepilin-type N-terminal cleavage/methylation domain-containing protein [Gammaproteobacteria bacterium]|nr:prepilin-type N-terminal cleavage/methylation domain-containing protein [Gammaproteobacteria bacterium]